MEMFPAASIAWRTKINVRVHTSCRLIGRFHGVCTCLQRSEVRREDRVITREQVVAKLLESQGGATQRDGRRIGAVSVFTNDTLKGRRAPGEKVLAFLSTEKDELCELLCINYVLGGRMKLSSALDLDLFLRYEATGHNNCAFRPRRDALGIQSRRARRPPALV